MQTRRSFNSAKRPNAAISQPRAERRSPRRAFNFARQADRALLDELMLSFDSAAVNALCAAVDRSPAGLPHPQFVLFMEQRLGEWLPGLPDRLERVRRCLDLFFRQLDLNANGLLEKDELTAYITERAEALEQREGLGRVVAGAGVEVLHGLCAVEAEEQRQVLLARKEIFLPVAVH